MTRLPTISIPKIREEGNLEYILLSETFSAQNLIFFISFQLSVCQWLELTTADLKRRGRSGFFSDAGDRWVFDTSAGPVNVGMFSYKYSMGVSGRKALSNEFEQEVGLLGHKWSFKFFCYTITVFCLHLLVRKSLNSGTTISYN